MSTASEASSSAVLDPTRVAELTAAENERFVATHPRSRDLFERARAVMPGGVPMSWMVKWPGAYPVFVAEASGAHFVDVDGQSLEFRPDRDILGCVVYTQE